MSDEKSAVASGYAFGQLERAMRIAVVGADAAVRQRAVVKTAKWQAALDVIARGRLTVGSRTPVANTPA